MSKYFEAAVVRFTENCPDFHLITSQESDGSESAILANDSLRVKMVYSPSLKRFYLFQGEPDGGDDDFEEVQSYFFELSGDHAIDMKEAVSVGNEFSDSYSAHPAMEVNVPTASRVTARKDRENDETSAVYFVNRIPAVLPECREPLLQHKEHYEMLLPNKFCEEVVNAAVAKMLADKTQKGKAEEFFTFLEKMYGMGDLDVKSIITMTILNAITGEERIAYVEGLLSSDMNKAWRASRRYIGKNVRPEKESTYQQMSKKYRAQLNNGGQF